MSAKNNPAASDPSDREIVISRVLAADRELVWQAMTDPAHVVHWWGPRGFSTTIETMDVRPGGLWKQTLHGPDGANYPNKSVFKEVVRPARLVFSHAGGREEGPGASFVSTWTFDAIEPGRTKVTIRMVFPSAKDRDFVVKEFRAIEGGHQTLARLDEHLPAMPKPEAREKIVVKRVFAAPAEMVFDAWLAPESVGQWLFATPDGKMARVEIDARVGGRFIITEQRGGELVEHTGTYVELERPRRLAFDFSVPKYSAEKTRVTVEIAPHAAGCELTLTHEGVWSEYRERTASGWAGILDGLGRSLGGGGKEFVLTRVFDAPRDLVWRAWTDPEHLQRWFGPKGFTMPTCSLDLRPGGIFHYAMKSPDGHEMWGKWTFLEIVPGEKLVVIASFSDAQRGVTRHPLSATWPLQMLSHTTFADENGRTRLTLRCSAYQATEVEKKTFDDNHPGMVQGWGGTMQQLEAYLAAEQQRR